MRRLRVACGRSGAAVCGGAGADAVDGVGALGPLTCAAAPCALWSEVVLPHLPTSGHKPFRGFVFVHLREFGPRAARAPRGGSSPGWRCLWRAQLRGTPGGDAVRLGGCDWCRSTARRGDRAAAWQPEAQCAVRASKAPSAPLLRLQQLWPEPRARRPPMTYSQCTAPGQCTTVNGAAVLE